MTDEQTNTTGHPEQRRSPGGRDTGSTFVEVVVTIVLIGVVVIPILAAVKSSIRASSTTESAAAVETLLVNAVDRVNRAPVTECNLEPAVQAAVETYGWPASAASATHEYLQSDDSWSSDVGTQPCYEQVRRITITITDPDSGLQRQIEVVKSDF